MAAPESSSPFLPAAPCPGRDRGAGLGLLVLALVLGLGGLGLGYWTGRGRVASLTTSPPEVPYRAVVALETHTADGTVHWASGSIVSPDGLILTCAHAVWPAEQSAPPARIVVHMLNEVDQPPAPRYEARVVQLDTALDLAVLRVVADAQGHPVDPASLHLPSLPLGDPEALTLGAPLTVLGYPNIGGTTLTLTQGVVAGFRAQAPYGSRAWIKTTAAVARGSSGGAVLDRSGHLVAVPVQVGAGDGAPVADCRVVVDTNQDGVVDSDDRCIPVGGFLNALRPVSLARRLIDAARAGQVRVPTPWPTPT
ncbi:MAG: trypsin-like peptidase domain-containing protein, partial [Chloroflexi bacterium]|nr:trypsin-like peptidase domain-containing protein [Chloroflexota bacterium]